MLLAFSAINSMFDLLLLKVSAILLILGITDRIAKKASVCVSLDRREPRSDKGDLRNVIEATVKRNATTTASIRQRIVMNDDDAVYVPPKAKPARQVSLN